LRDRQVANIDATGAAVVAAGNLGCITQISGGSAKPVLHTVELLDWAYGGEMPPRLEKAARAAAAQLESVKLSA
jgi:glycolate oxidase iron-sulfur subunit